MTLDWDLIQASSVVVSYEFLILGVLVLFARALRTPQAEQAGQGAGADESVRPPAGVESQVLLAHSGDASDVSQPRFLAVGTAPNLASAIDQRFERPDSQDRVQPWAEPADWADLVVQPRVGKRVRRRKSPRKRRAPLSPVPMPGLPPERAARLRPKSAPSTQGAAVDRGHPIFDKKTVLCVRKPRRVS